MNQLQTNKLTQIFSYQSKQVRTVIKDGEPWFVAKDVCEILDIEKYRDAVTRLNENQRGSVVVDTLGGKQEVTAINESGVYKLVFTSRKPEAEKFTDWLAIEVIPSIRKHGAYMTPEKIEDILSNPDTIIKLATDLKQERANRLLAEQQLEENKPKMLFAEAVSTSKASILVGELSKIVKQNGVDIGQNRLFQWLRESGYLCNRGENHNLPTQYSMDLELMEIKKTTINNPDGTSRVTRTPKVTGKGQIYFVNKLLKQEVTV